MAERIQLGVAKLVVFKAILASDDVSPATGKTIAITISKNGATSFSNLAAGATNATEMASGWYKFTLGAGDTDTAGPLTWRGAEGTINDAGDVLVVADVNDEIETACDEALLAAGFSTAEDVALEVLAQAIIAPIICQLAAGVTHGGADAEMSLDAATITVLGVTNFSASNFTVTNNLIAWPAVWTTAAQAASAAVITAASLATAANLATANAALVKVQAAVYDSATVSGSTITLSTGATQIISGAGRSTAP